MKSFIILFVSVFLIAGCFEPRETLTKEQTRNKEITHPRNYLEIINAFKAEVDSVVYFDLFIRNNAVLTSYNNVYLEIIWINETKEKIKRVGNLINKTFEPQKTLDFKINVGKAPEGAVDWDINIKNARYLK